MEYVYYIVMYIVLNDVKAIFSSVIVMVNITAQRKQMQLVLMARISDQKIFSRPSVTFIKNPVKLVPAKTTKEDTYIYQMVIILNITEQRKLTQLLLNTWSSL